MAELTRADFPPGGVWTRIFVWLDRWQGCRVPPKPRSLEELAGLDSDQILRVTGIGFGNRKLLEQLLQPIRDADRTRALQQPNREGPADGAIAEESQQLPTAGV